RNADESLEARVRGLPAPPIPAGLESRLLSSVPATIPTSLPRWPRYSGALAAIAAAVVLAVVVWQLRPGKSAIQGPPAPNSARVVQADSPSALDVAADPSARRILDEPELPLFSWPIQETSPMRASTSIASDRLD